MKGRRIHHNLQCCWGRCLCWFLLSTSWLPILTLGNLYTCSFNGCWRELNMKYCGNKRILPDQPLFLIRTDFLVIIVDMPRTSQNLNPVAQASLNKQNKQIKYQFLCGWWCRCFVVGISRVKTFSEIYWRMGKNEECFSGKQRGNVRTGHRQG